MGAIDRRAVARVAIVGNGAIGLGIALSTKTALPDVDVVVVGPFAAAGGASRAAGAMLGLFGEVTKSTEASDAGREKFTIGQAAHPMWPEYVDRLNSVTSAAPAVEVTAGTYVIHNSRGGVLDSENFDAMVAALRAHGEPFELGVDVPGLDPTPDGRPLATAYLPGEGSIDSGPALDRMVALSAALGVRHIDDHVVAVQHDGHRVTGLTLARDGDLAADSVVVAAGAFSSPLLDGLPFEHPIQPVVAGSGVAYMTERVLGTGFTSTVRTVNRAGSCGLHVVPLGRGREYIGATNVIFREPEVRPHIGVCHFVADSAMDQLDHHVVYSRIDDIRIGNRPVPLDSFPLLGPTSVEGLVVVTGTYRDGFHASPLLAELTAQTIATGRSAFPSIFAPERVPLLTMTVAESTQEYVHQSISSAYEGRTRLTPFMRYDDLAAVFRPKADALYARLQLSAGLPSDLVTFLTLTRKRESDIDVVAVYLRQVGLAA